MRSSLVVMCFAVCIILLFVGTICCLSSPEPVSYQEYKVQRGDSLWSIAQQSDGWNEIDGQDIVDDIKQKSQCTSVIHPGQIVFVPMYHE